MGLAGRYLCAVLLATLSCLHHSGATAAQPAVGKISHLFDITDSSIGSLTLPTDVEFFGSHIYVVDSGNNRLVVFSEDGKTHFTIGQEGQGKGEFQDPVGLGIDSNGQIYVADSGNHRVQIFNAKGKYSGEIAISNNGRPIRPIDVAVDAKTNNIFVTGNESHNVMVFDQSGRKLREWGGNGAETGKFRYPATISVTSNFDIAVVDVFNTRVQLFQADGNFLIAIGEWGILPGQLFRPKGVAADRQGLIYVSDSYMNVIQVFNDSGKFQHVLKPNNSKQDLVTPSGIAVAGNNRLYIAEMLKHRISVYQIN